MISDADLLAYSRVSDETEIGTLRRLERAAIATVQVRTGRYLGPVAAITETVYFREWPLQLANVPVNGAITSLESWDGSAWSTVAATGYHIDGSLVRYEGGTSTTFTTRYPTRYRVTYNAGYADSGAEEWDAPEDIKQAVLMLVGHWYENRESVVVGSSQSGELPFAVSALLDGHMRVAV